MKLSARQPCLRTTLRQSQLVGGRFCSPPSASSSIHIAQPVLTRALHSPVSAQRTPVESPVSCEAAPPAAVAPTTSSPEASSGFLLAFSMFLLTEAPAALADTLSEASSPWNGAAANSLWVTLGLFLLSVPGIWSQIKRAPVAKKVRKTFLIDGPAAAGAIPLDDRARQVFKYFKQNNYDVKQSGEVITFTGTYSANRGQAAAVTFYTFFGLGSIALVLSTAFAGIGSWFYALTLFSPGAWFYYMGKGTRVEEVRVKMMTADDDMTTDIIVEGDTEEIERFRKELSLMEKGKVYVKGLLEK